MDNGGEAMKLGFCHAQMFKVEQKLQREYVRQPNGLLKQNGPSIRRKGNKYLVDCCFTGSSQGTSDDPKFALKDMFAFYVFPQLVQLVGPGGEYEGYTVVIQLGDNTDHMTFVTE
jgi:hypothetical protein